MYKSVSKSSASKQNLKTVWAIHSGKFNDGIEEKIPTPNAKPDRYGPRMRELMKKNGLTKEDMETNICIECQVKHHRKSKRCVQCDNARRKQGLRSY